MQPESTNEPLIPFILRHGEWRASVQQPYLVVKARALHPGVEAEFGVAPISSKEGWVWTIKSRRTLRVLCQFLLRPGPVAPDYPHPPFWLEDAKRVYDWTLADVHKPRVRELTEDLRWLADFLNTTDEDHAYFKTDFTKKGQARCVVTVRGPRGSDDRLAAIQREFGGRLIKGYASSRATHFSGGSGFRFVWTNRQADQIEDLIWTLMPLLEDSMPAQQAGLMLNMIRDMKPPGCPEEYYYPTRKIPA